MAPHPYPSEIYDRFPSLLLNSVERQAGTDDSGRLTPLAVGIEIRHRSDPDPEVVICTRSLGGGTDGDLIADLVGFDAPAEWMGFGIVADVVGVSRATVAHVAYRDCGARAEIRGGPPDGPVDASDATGLIPDLCRRVLGQPTPAPEHPVAVYWTSLWLDNVLGEILARGARGPGLTVGEMFELHPFGERHRHPSLPGTAAAALARGAAEVHERFDWSTLRDRFAEGGAGVSDFGTAVARWMDDGMFSRWLMADLPPLEPLVDDLLVLLEPTVGGGLLEVLDEWDLGPRL